MDGSKKMQIDSEFLAEFPVKFKYINYWKFSEEPGRIDNFDDPYFRGVDSAKYQTDNFASMGHYKPISKIVNLGVLSNGKK